MGNAASQKQVFPNHEEDEDVKLENEEVTQEAVKTTASTASVTGKVSKKEEDAIEKNKKREEILQQFPRLRDHLKEIGETCSTLKPYEDNDVTKKTMSLQVVRTLEELYEYYFEYDQPEQREMIGDALANSGAAVPFQLYMIILTDDCTAYPLEGYKFECYQVLRSVCWNYSDTSPQFADELGRAGMLPVMLKDLQKFQNTFKGSSVQSFIVLSAMGVLNNCSKSSNNAKYYREINAVETVAWYAKNTSGIPGTEVLAPMSALTLAFIVDEKHNDIITADNSLIETILKLIGGALTSPNRRCDGFSSVELVEGLTKLASNADNSAVMMELGVTKHIVQLMNGGSEEEQTSACKATWVLAFSEKNKLQLKSNTQVVEKLTKFADSQNITLKNAAKGALWVLGIREGKQEKAPPKEEEEDAEQSKRPKKKKKKRGREANSRTSAISSITLRPAAEENDLIDTAGLDDLSEEDNFFDNSQNLDEVCASEEMAGKSNKGVSHVMVSYQWDHQSLMIRLKTRLEGLGYKMWMDIDEMGGSTLQSMAEAVENAAVILVCFSQKYKDSVSCRTEAEYAYQCKKKIVPIRVEQQYQPDGWLGAILGAKFYYDYSNLAMFENMTSGLVKELGESGKSVKKEKKWSMVKAVAPVVIQKKRRVVDWTNEEVKKWADEKNLKSFQTKDVDGRVLLFLRQLKQVAPEFFYKRMSDQHGLKNIRDLMFFSEALDNLS